MTIDLGGLIPDDEEDDRFQRAKRDFEEQRWRFRAFPGLEYARALFRLMCDPEKPWHQRALAAAALLYLVIPLDAYPDCLPGGLLDDLAVILAVVLSLSDLVEPYLEEEG
ncbi:MAG: DUF1232 domain-containing protein [Planctomycetes bacterium]|nr:DUF1232 domain-containing protein [Planctomycetota bacterium]